MNHIIFLVMVVMVVCMVEGKKLIIKTKGNKSLAHIKDDKHGKIRKTASDYKLTGAETEILGKGNFC